MTGRQLVPQPPQWALDAGLPEPEKDESFEDYVTRLGLSCSELLEGLVPRTMVLAHVRLMHKLAEACPEAWEAHVQAFVKSFARPPKPPKPVPFRR